MANDYVALANTTLGSSSSSVTFSSIPQEYRDLVMVFYGTTNTTSDFLTYFNNDITNSNYSRYYFFGNGSTVATPSASEAAPLFWYSTTGTPAMNFLEILDYSRTDKHKSVLAKYRQSTNGAGLTVGRWGNTAAITSIQTIPTAGVFNAGCVFTLYGIRG